MTERVPGSFRDPAGFVFRRDGVLYRQVNDAHRATYDACVEAGLFTELQDAGLVVKHEVVDHPAADPSRGTLVIRPEEIPFVSYPYEWSPGQLRAAAELTLELQRRALDKGFILRDASAYNVQFLHGRPIFIDTLSFEPWVEGEAWVAYGQFCRHFLAPLALTRYRDVRLAHLTRVEIDGVPLDLASRLLPVRTRFSFGLGIHIHAHARSQRVHADDGGIGSAAPAARRMSRQAMLGLVDSLASVTRKQRWEPPKSAWRDYYGARDSYSGSSLEHKESIVRQLLATTGAATVWDFGANTGRFSRIAADVTGAHVVALEMDVSAVELNWRECVAAPEPPVLPLVVDLSNPSPSQGWAHVERDSLEARGPVDVGLALALVHHLAIGNNVPLQDVAAWFARLARTLIIEWIPKEDPMVQRLLATRQDVFDDYTTESFEAAIEQHFEVRDRHEVEGSLRTVYVLEAR